MIERAAGAGAARLPVTQAADGERAGAVVGEALDDAREQALEVGAFGRRQMLEHRRDRQRRVARGCAPRSASPARERERMCARVPARAPLDEAGGDEPIDEPARAGLGQPHDALDVADGSAGVRPQVDERGRPAALLCARLLRGLAHAVGHGERLRRQQLLEARVAARHDPNYTHESCMYVRTRGF